MKDIIEKNLNIISDYERQAQYQAQYQRCLLPPVPQNVQEARIELEKVLCEVTLKDSAALKTILNEFVARLSSFHGVMAYVAARHNIDSLEVLIDKLGARVLTAIDRSGDTVTSHAATYNSNALELLIDRFGEAILAIKDSCGSIALHLAASHRDALKLSIDKIPEASIRLFTEKR